MKMNRKQLKGIEPVKNVKSSPALPVSGPQEPEAPMENPRSYLVGVGDHVKHGHTVIPADLDPTDRARNHNRMGRF